MLPRKLSPPVTPPVDTQEVDRNAQILSFCKTPRSRSEIQNFINIKDAKDFRNRILNPLIKSGILKLEIPDKPTSPKQRYYS